MVDERVDEVIDHHPPDLAPGGSGHSHTMGAADGEPDSILGDQARAKTLLVSSVGPGVAGSNCSW